MMTKTILVTGATGKQGGGVIDALLRQTEVTFNILAVTRDVTSRKARDLAHRHPTIKLVQGDLDDIDALWTAAEQASATARIWGVYSVQISMGHGVTEESEVAQGKALIHRAVGAEVSMFVYSSVERGGDVESWDNETPVGHFKSKFRIERYLRDITGRGQPGEKMKWTVLRPVAFMENLEPGFKTSVFLTALRNKLKDKPLQWVASSDVGVFAAMAFVDPAGWDGMAVGLAGDELTLDGVNQAFLAATGKAAPSTYWFFGSMLLMVVKEMGDMVRWFASDGYKADIEGRRRDYPQLMTLEQYLKQDMAWQETVQSKK